MSYKLASGGIGNTIVSEEVSTKDRLERVAMHVKRRYWDLEGHGRARVQRVRGNVTKMRKRIASRREKFGSGVDEGTVDPERADGSGVK